MNAGLRTDTAMTNQTKRANEMKGELKARDDQIEKLTAEVKEVNENKFKQCEKLRKEKSQVMKNLEEVIDELKKELDVKEQ